MAALSIGKSIMPVTVWYKRNHKHTNGGKQRISKSSKTTTKKLNRHRKDTYDHKFMNKTWMWLLCGHWYRQPYRRGRQWDTKLAIHCHIANTHLLSSKNHHFLDTQVSLAPTPVRTSVSSNVGHTFGFPFCQRHWNLTKRRDGIAMVDIELHMMADNPIFPVPLPSKKDQNCRDRDVTLSYKAWNVLKQVHFAEAVWCVSSKLISKFICPEMKMRF